MSPRLLFPVFAFALLSVSLSGCGIPGGIAQLVKTAERSQDGGPAPDPKPAPPPPAEPAVYRDQPPPPAAAPRSSVSVEQLPPAR
jgi:hypothetical protein